MKKINNILIIAAVLMITSVPGMAQIVQQSAAGNVLNFHYDYSTMKGAEDKTLLEFYYQVSNNDITFIRNEKGFSGKYEVSVSVLDRNTERIIDYRTKEDELILDNYDATIRKGNHWINQFNFYIKPGDYRIRVVLNNINSDHENRFMDDISVPDYNSAEGIIISDIQLVREKMRNTVNPLFKKGSNLNLVPNPSSIYGDVLPNLLVYYELYNLPFNEANNGKLTVEYRILNYKNGIENSFFEDLSFKSGSSTQFAKIAIKDLFDGKYYLEIRVRSNNGEEYVSSRKLFYINRSFGPIHDDIDKSISYLMYIATEEEMERLKKADVNERTKAWLEFWKTKDMTPNTPENEFMEEYYRRIRYANKNFTHLTEGWKSDRGRIYILLGQPDEVSRNYLFGRNVADINHTGFNDYIGFDLYDQNQQRLHGSKPCIIWYYYNLQKKFIFVDKHGAGGYKLLNQRYDW